MDNNLNPEYLNNLSGLLCLYNKAIVFNVFPSPSKILYGTQIYYKDKMRHPWLKALGSYSLVTSPSHQSPKRHLVREPFGNLLGAASELPLPRTTRWLCGPPHPVLRASVEPPAALLG